MIASIFFNDGFVADVGEKVNIFNSFFASQCTPIGNGSRLITPPPSPPPPPIFKDKGNKRLSNVEINDNDILSIITSLDPNK